MGSNKFNFEVKEAKSFYHNLESLYDDYIKNCEGEVVASDGKSIQVEVFQLFGLKVVEHTFYWYTKGVSITLRLDLYFHKSKEPILRSICKDCTYKIDTPPYAEDDVIEFIFSSDYEMVYFLWYYLDLVKEHALTETPKTCFDNGQK